MTQQVHDLCTEWLCFYFLCFTLQVSTVVVFLFSVFYPAGQHSGCVSIFCVLPCRSAQWLCFYFLCFTLQVSTVVVFVFSVFYPAGQHSGCVCIFCVLPCRSSGPSVGHREVGTVATWCVLWQLSHGKQTELDFSVF